MADKRGMRNYRENMRHYHRYAVCRQKLNEGAKWTDGEVYAMAGKALEGTSFGGGKTR